MHRKKYRVIDTTALLTRHLPLNQDYLNVTTEDILKEVKKDPLTKTIIESYLISRQLLTMKPKKRYINKAIELSLSTGDYKRLSKEDLSLIAIALELKDKGHYIEVVTDDFSIQNILRHIGINTLSYFRKIKETYNWILVCRKCGASYPNEYDKDTCDKCGGEIIRKRVR